MTGNRGGFVPVRGRAIALTLIYGNYAYIDNDRRRLIESRTYDGRDRFD